MALGVALEVGKYAFQGGLAGLLGIGAVANGVSLIAGVADCCVPEAGKEHCTWEKAQKVFLSAVRCIGMTAGLFDWARFCGWISLGALTPYVGFIGYPALLITGLFELVEEWNEVEALEDKIANPRESVPYPDWQRAVHYLKLLGRVGLVAFPIIAGAGFITMNPALSLAGFLLITATGFLFGVAYGIKKLIEKWEEQKAPKPTTA